MTKTKSFSHIIACMLAVVMVLSCLCVPAFAAPHPEDGMLPTKEVTPVGTKSFYKIDIENGIVIYADTDDGTGWTAVPSAYITGSSYNEGNIPYGAYIVDGDEVVFVPLSECHQTESGDYEYYHGTKDSATVSEDVDTATNEDPTMGTDFYLHVENGIDPDCMFACMVTVGRARWSLLRATLISSRTIPLSIWTAMHPSLTL